MKVRDDGEWPWSRGSPRGWWPVATACSPPAVQRVHHVTDRLAAVLAQGLVPDASPHFLFSPTVQRPASLDLPCPTAPGGESLHSSGLLHRELPQIPVPEPPAASPAPDQTYSNLLFTPLRKPAPDTVYECLAMGGEDASVPPMPTGTQVSPPRAVHEAADYACVHKVKKVVSVEVQDGAVAGSSGAQHCWDGAGNAPQAKVRLWGATGMGHTGGHLIPCLPVVPMFGAGYKLGSTARILLGGCQKMGRTKS